LPVKTSMVLYRKQRFLHSSTVPTAGGHAQDFPYCPHELSLHISRISWRYEISDGFINPY
jgi:hypothetical protein